MRFYKIFPESFFILQKKNRSNYGTVFLFYLLLGIGELELISYSYLNHAIIWYNS